MKPCHVQVGTRFVETLRCVTRACVTSGGTFVLPDVGDVLDQLLGHVGVVLDLVVGVRVGVPVINAIHLYQNTRLSMPITAKGY